MAWTKGELISEAFAELAIAGRDFDITPEEQQFALRRMDSMVTMWDARGIQIGYQLPRNPGESDLNAVTDIPDTAAEAVFLNLAIRLASAFGKALTQDTKTNARDAFDVLLRAAAMPMQQQMPNTMPRGAGNKHWQITQQPFFPTPEVDPLAADNDLDFLPE
jgi:hypothetical protein